VTTWTRALRRALARRPVQIVGIWTVAVLAVAGMTAAALVGTPWTSGPRDPGALAADVRTPDPDTTPADPSDDASATGGVLGSSTATTLAPTTASPEASAPDTAQAPGADGNGDGEDGGGAPAPAAPPSSFPGAASTGPSGQLAAYSGPCEITRAGTVLESRDITCDLLIKAPDVVIRNSRVTGIVDVDSNTPGASATVEDTEIDAGTAYRAAVSSHDVTVRRSEIRGGQHGVQCYERCRVERSWIHSQYVPPDGDWHLNGFLSNGGTDMVLVGNRLECDVPITRNDGGCTAAAAIFGDFEPVARFTFDGNLFVASLTQPYCAYGGSDAGKPYASQTRDIVFVNNVFQRGSNGKCGLYGPVTSFDPGRPGNVWRNNTWDDGSPVNPG
jgi:hypothetical protein